MPEKLIIGIAPAMSVEITGDTRQQIIEQAAFWSMLPATCPICNAPVIFTYRKPKGFDYYGMKCLGSPAHETTFGEFQEKSRGMYYREGDQWKKFITSREHENGEQDLHGELEREIETAWKKTGRTQPLSEAIKARYNSTLSQLSIDEKRHVLQSLTAI